MTKQAPALMRAIEKARRVKSCQMIASAAREVCDLCATPEHDKVREIAAKFTNPARWYGSGAPYMHKKAVEMFGLALDEVYTAELG